MILKKIRLQEDEWSSEEPKEIDGEEGLEEPVEPGDDETEDDEEW